MRILITGGTGFIGRRLAEHVAADGHSLTALVRSASGSDHLVRLGARVVIGDVTSGSGLGEALRDVDCVLHLAGVVKAFSGAGYAQVNVAGTRRLCAVAIGSSPPPRMVLCSSLAAAGPSRPGRPHREEDSPAPVSHYGRSKLAGEEALRTFSSALSAAIVRPPIVYGPGDREFLPVMSSMVRRRVVLSVGNGPHLYSLIHVDDLCRALLAVAQHGDRLSSRHETAGLYYVSDGREYRLEAIAEALADALATRKPVRVAVPVSAARFVAAGTALVTRARNRPTMLNPDKIREARCPACTCSPQRIARELGYKPSVDLVTGLAGTLQPMKTSRV